MDASSISEAGDLSDGSECHAPILVHRHPAWSIRRIVLPLLLGLLFFVPKLKLFRFLLYLRGKSAAVAFGLLGRSIYRWAHHVEEYVNDKPLLTLDEHCIVVEKGGAPYRIAYDEMTGLFIRQYDGDVHGRFGWMRRPPYWLDLRYVTEGRDEDGERAAQIVCLEVWPQQVRGGLFRLVRFARALERRLVERGIEPALID